MLTHASILAWRFHGLRSLVGYRPQDCKESKVTEQLSTHAGSQPRRVEVRRAWRGISFSAVSLSYLGQVFFPYQGLFIYKWIDREASTARLPPTDVVSMGPVL